VVPAQIEDQDVLPRGHLPVEVVGQDPGGGEPVDEVIPEDEPPGNRDSDPGEEDPPHPALDPPRGLRDLLPERPSEHRSNPRPEENAQEVEGKEPRDRHPGHPGKGRHDRVHSREKFREEDRRLLAAVEPVDRPLETGIRVERDPAEVEQHPFPPPAPAVDACCETASRGRGRLEARRDRHRRDGVVPAG